MLAKVYIDRYLGHQHNLKMTPNRLSFDSFLFIASSQYLPVAPVAYQVILEPGIGQFREFEPRRVHTRIDSLRLISCAQIDLRNAYSYRFVETYFLCTH